MCSSHPRSASDNVDASSAYMHSREGSEKAEQIGNPENNNDDHHPVKDGLDGGLHWDEAVYEPQQNSNDDESNHQLHQWHNSSSFTSRG
jgi:hypothetical protein